MRVIYCVNTNGVGSALVVRSIFAASRPCTIIISTNSRLHILLKETSLAISPNIVILPAFCRNFFLSSLFKIFPLSFMFFKGFSSVLVCDDIPFLFVPRQVLFLQQMSLFKNNSFKWRILRLYFLLALPRCSSIIVQSVQMSAYLRRFCPSIASRIIVFNHVLPS